jgi:hypothetical protein
MFPEDSKRSRRGAPRNRPLSGEDQASSPLETQLQTTSDWWRQDQRSSESSPAAPPQTGQPAEAAADLVGKAKETARATAKALSSQAAELAGNIGSELTDTAEEQKGRGADAMRAVAKVVHGAANELDGQSPTVARYVRSAAESVEGLSDTIRSRNVRELMTAASDTARTHPTAFFIGAVAAGFALSRFLKSTLRSSTGEVGVQSAAPKNPIGRPQPSDSLSPHEGTSGFGVGA